VEAEYVDGRGGTSGQMLEWIANWPIYQFGVERDRTVGARNRGERAILAFYEPPQGSSTVPKLLFLLA
jgi:hypothetical protein